MRGLISQEEGLRVLTLPAELERSETLIPGTVWNFWGMLAPLLQSEQVSRRNRACVAGLYPLRNMLCASRSTRCLWADSKCSGRRTPLFPQVQRGRSGSCRTSSGCQASSCLDIRLSSRWPNALTRGRFFRSACGYSPPSTRSCAYESLFFCCGVLSRAILVNSLARRANVSYR
jgi:hypothetical protein